MACYALFYEVVGAFAMRWVPFREGHLRLTDAAYRQGKRCNSLPTPKNGRRIRLITFLAPACRRFPEC